MKKQRSIINLSLSRGDAEILRDEFREEFLPMLDCHGESCAMQEGGRIIPLRERELICWKFFQQIAFACGNLSGKDARSIALCIRNLSESEEA